MSGSEKGKHFLFHVPKKHASDRTGPQKKIMEAVPDFIAVDPEYLPHQAPGPVSIDRPSHPATGAETRPEALRFGGRKKNDDPLTLHPLPVAVHL